MALSRVNYESDICNDFTKCSICFEDFKSPKCLPCSHSFCHECLKNHIESSCLSKQSPVGFSCPLCRDFIPAENILAKLKDWANDFPTNDRLGNISQASQGNLCDGCQRDGEEEEAKQFCLMCKEKLCGMCVKYHRRLVVTKDHEVLSMDELKKSPIVMETRKSCYTHAEEIIRYYCQDHSIPCCTVCICTGHRKCDNIETVTETAERLRTKEHYKLFVAMGELEKEMTDIKNKLEKNIADIEETSDNLSEEAEALYTKLQKHIEKIKNEYLRKLSEKSKECRGKLQENSDSLGDKFAYLKRCKKSFNSMKEERDDAQFVREFYEISEKYSTLKDLYLRNKTCFKLMKVTSNFDSKCFEGMDYLGNANVEIIKTFHTGENRMPTPSELHYAYLMRTRKSYKT